MRVNHQSYNVVLLPSEVTKKEAIRLSRDIANKFPVEFLLDGKIRYPHLTLYQFELPTKNLKLAFNRLRKIFKRYPKIILKPKGMSCNETWVSWDYQKNQRLYDLHKKIIEQLNSLRDGLIVPSFDDQKPISPQQQRLIDGFGTKGILRYFRPHITITRIKIKVNDRILLTTFPAKRRLTSLFAKAALGELSRHGTVTKIIEEFNLA